MIKEDILQFIWEIRMFDQKELKTTCGRDVTILSPGRQNFDAGPDFFNAKIIIGNMIWAGNVEVHKRSSDWEKHGHHLDGSYNNVILHVVVEEDETCLNTLGRKILTLLLPEPAIPLPFQRVLQDQEFWLPCHAHIQTVSNILLKRWLTKLQGERLDRKNSLITNLLFRNKGNWEETLCHVLAYSFGLPLNSLPFQMTISRIPFELLMQNRDSLPMLEALLFGQAGFLNKDHLMGPYDQNLYRSYSAHLTTFQALPVELHLWKFLRLRPASFPTLRISQFASLLHKRLPLLESILDITSVSSAEQFLRVESSTYWDTHYLFGKGSPESRKALGQQTIHTLIINGLVPFLLSYGQTMNHLPAINLGNKLLMETKSEDNQIIKKWAIFGIRPEGAFESQALIQLHNAYCKQKRCLDCPIAAGFLPSSGEVNPLIL
jgi:hypothetical protein